MVGIIAGHVSSWYIGKVTHIRKILGSRRKILMRKWGEFIMRNWRNKRVKIRHIKWIQNHYAITKKYGREECKDATQSET